MATIEYLSWSAFLLTSDAGVRVVIDPWISGNAERGIEPSPRSVADLASADLVLVTHAAHDHLGQAFDLIRAGNASIAGSLDIRLLTEDAGLDVARTVMMVPNSPYVLGDVTVIPTEAKHHSASQLGNGQWLFGKPLSYFVRLGSEACVFHGGDTAISLDLQLYGELYAPTLALLGVGGLAHPGRQSIVEMSPAEAARAARMLGVKGAIPCHYMPGSDAPKAFRDALASLAPGVEASILAPGSAISVPLASPRAGGAS